MTLVYAGELKDLKLSDFNALAKDACSIAMVTNPISLRVTGVDVFGTDPDPKVDVLTLQPNAELLSIRHMVEAWDASEFGFNPHCTIGPAGGYTQEPPYALTFDKIMVGWGDEQLVFRLKPITGMPY
jgi:2'-5' RNA ligase